jgi:hypothetical protein
MARKSYNFNLPKHFVMGMDADFHDMGFWRP